MQIQRIQSTNQTTFNARLSIKDGGKCLTSIQREELKQIAQKIGLDTDRIFIGTREYDNIDFISEENHFKRLEGIVLSLVDNKVVDMRFDKENMFENIAEYLKTFSNDGHNFYKVKPQNIADEISYLKDKIKEFCSLKKTYRTHYEKQTSKETVTNEPTGNKIGWTKEQFIEHIQQKIEKRNFTKSDLKDSEVRNLAKLLGTTEEQIRNMDKQEYRRLSIKFHPDSAGKEKEDIFCILNSLYNCNH
jgi:arsenate reductase-like glutaredoxin family protein